MWRGVMIKRKLEIKKMCEGDYYFLAWGGGVVGGWDKIFIFLVFPGFSWVFHGLSGGRPCRTPSPRPSPQGRGRIIGSAIKGHRLLSFPARSKRAPSPWGVGVGVHRH